jgi:putative transposase
VNLFVAGACPARRRFSVYFLVCETQKEDGACASHLASFGKLLEPIQRRQFDTLVKRHAGDAYVKSFPSWNHVLALVYAQFSAAVNRKADILTATTAKAS